MQPRTECFYALFFAYVSSLSFLEFSREQKNFTFNVYLCTAAMDRTQRSSDKNPKGISFRCLFFPRVGDLNR